MNNRKLLFIGGIIVAIVALLCSIYYIIPGYNHILVTHDSTASHPTHFVAFLGLAIVGALVALVSRPKKGVNPEQA
ncbi:hypothetical protein KSD_64190 [Ktedonobacter sp. SOSP1-85]|uniref:hypothetical protein n=1 Tax=Ktedonobacter sp. SOSP1-85 TaxID=2778367 RepID=UPI001915AC78|nr:hypothetical protein [Ktedonobacter sp. SOSP1-85]GHO78648.1 hypothetical protein KSD_64190 [Ktedonobacter sp. SOSP1-85]